ncbi:hypothetical protein O3M35_003814 [Rhynocoris fuscipes]|uniref:Fibronectin type-III domain-containing protein n=1 Tax=Rhynocoris fuscipes TaxID=488301 RepID=A0AAW1CIM7_9HEMI
MQYHCPGGTDEHYSYCLWNSSSDPVYRQVLEHYHFKMFISNALGNLTTTYEINHNAVVVPNKAIKLKLVGATPTSLCISWERPIGLFGFSTGIVPKVIYHSEWDSVNYWRAVDTSHLNIKDSKHTLNITGLRFAHSLYDIRVLLRSAAAKDEPMWWSEPAAITLRTNATVPGMPPKTDIGSFETLDVESLRDITIYWQQIPRYFENGDLFEYKIIRIEELIGENRTERNINPKEITKTYAKFTNLTHNTYVFSIVSSNKEGYSSNISYITVPSRQNKLPEPASFTKIAHNFGVYELSWSAPYGVFVNSYTIFWCESKNDRPFDCTGYLNWTNVGNITEKNITLPEEKLYQFAISANNAYSSSGMLWAKCTVRPDRARETWKNAWINRIGPTFIEVSWKLDCFERVKIRGFVIAFCPIVSPQNSSCKEPIQNKTITGDPTHGKITGLKPYTTYKVRIAVRTNNWEGMWTDSLYNTTLEAAPDSSPVNVNVLESTNTSIRLSWSPPPSLNGALRYYQIYWNENVTKVEDKSETVYLNLTDLLSDELYTIRLSACTVECSANSSVVSVRTKIGKPSQISPPSVKFTNTTEIMYVSWNRPRLPGGPIDHYLIKIEKSEDGNIFDEPKIYESKGLSTEIDTPECKFIGSAILYRVYVRAVNKDASGVEYFGPWSLPGEDNCITPTGIVHFIFLYLFFFWSTLSIFFFTNIATNNAWLRFKAMQNVGVKLPPQLELNSVFKDKSVSDLPITSHVCSSSIKPHQFQSDLLDEHATPDQQLLLDNKNKDEGCCDSPCDELDDMALEETGSGGEDGHVESSGCGSGHDSVSSSITAGTHITDSGTEADERPASPDVFSQSPRRPSSDLRQRNITGGNSGGGSGEGYSRLAAAPTGYVTLPQGPRSYVSHGNMWPHNGTGVQHKGYVIAPPHSATYSKVGLLPTAGLKITSNREHCGDTENSTRNDNHLSINHAASSK